MINRLIRNAAFWAIWRLARSSKRSESFSVTRFLSADPRGLRRGSRHVMLKWVSRDL